MRSSSIHQLFNCGGCGSDLSSVERRLRCSHCKSAYFCNKQCQRKAWPRHSSVCFDASQTTPEMHTEAANSAPEMATKVFEEYLRTEMAVGHPLCLVITDVANAADNMQIMDPQTVRTAMWLDLSYNQRAKFETDCLEHAEARGMNGNAHVVYLDRHAKHFSTTIVPIRPKPVQDAHVEPMDLTELPDREELVQIIASESYVEKIIGMEYDKMRLQDTEMGIQYIQSIYDSAYQMFGGETDASHRAKAFAKKILQDLGRIPNDSPDDSTKTKK